MTRSVSEALPLRPPKNLAFELQMPQINITWDIDLPGDYNGDRSTNGLDLFRISSRFQQPVDQEPDNSCIDGNADGVIDGRDLFLISANFNNRVDGFNIYKRAEGADTVQLNESLIPWEPPSSPACSYDYLFSDDSGEFGQFYYSATTFGTGGESAASQEIAVLNTPFTIELQPGFADYAVQGSGDNLMSLTALVEGSTPSSYSWSTSAGELAEDSTTDPANTLIIDWRDADQTILVGVTGALDEWEVSDTVEIVIEPLSTPVISRISHTAMIADGGYAGEFLPGQEIHFEATAEDADGGEITYDWEATGGALILQNGLANLSVVLNEAETVSEVTLTVTDDNGGGQDSYSFSFATSGAGDPTNIMLLTAEACPDDPFNKVRVTLSQNHLNRLSHGVLAYIHYDDTKVEAQFTDGHTHEDNPYEPGIPFYLPHYEPSQMVFASHGSHTQPGPVFYIEFTIIGGRGSTVEFSMDQLASGFSDVHGTEVWTPDEFISAEYLIPE